jgi:hypothetical protein
MDPRKLSRLQDFCRPYLPDFKSIFCEDLKRPRFMVVAPNGDIFVAETGGSQITILRDSQNSAARSKRKCLSAS